MSLSSIGQSALSGLQAAQTGLRAVSDNVTNVDTAGYIRKVVNQQSSPTGGGVSAATVQLITNQFLQAANLNANSQSGQAGAVSNLMDQAQALFGDPTSTSSFFSQMDAVFSGFSTLSSAPATSASRAGALAQVSSFFDQANTISQGFVSLSSQADSSITDDVGTANNLLTQINQLNGEISRESVGGGDPTDAQNQQNQLINQLSSLMDVNVSATATGGVTVRASDGTVLAGNGGAAVLSYNGTGSVGEVMITPAGSTQAEPIGSRLSSGEISGLLALRNNQIPSLASQLSELTTQVANTLNSVSNAYSAVPAPNQLTGTPTGLDLPSSIAGFTGKTNVDIVNSSGVVQQQVAIDFGAGTMTVGGSTTSFTPATFLSSLNAALGTSGTASFSTSGALSIQAASGDGVAIADDPTTPSQNAGQGFSQYFGLNNVVTSNTVTNYNTGLTATSANPFTGSITLRMSSASGAWISDVTVAAPTGGTIGNLVSALNGSAISSYGAFSLDSSGQLSFQPTGNSGVTVAVGSDSTTSAPTGASMSTVFGIGDAVRSLRTSSFSVSSVMTANPSLLPLAQLNLAAASGTSALAVGDARGADALAQTAQTMVKFSAAGGLAATAQTLDSYASGLSGSIARQSSAADQANTTAQAVASEASARLSSTQGVNLDQEMVSLTTYQQAYSASARLLQAVSDMYNTLLQMTG